MLEIKDLCVSYGGKTVVRHFHLKLEQGSICTIAGESGSGKTTVIRAVSGLLAAGGRVTAGDILFEGKSMLSGSKEEWRKLRGTGISMIFQDTGAMLNPIRTIGSQFVEYIRIHERMPKRQARELAVTMLKRMQLLDGERVMKSYAFQLSGGMRQRVGIAMAMTFQPKLLLADEHASALDAVTQAEIVRQMKELKKGNTSILMVTHNLGVAAYMSDEMILMKDGKITDRGSKEHLLQSGNAYTKKLLEAVPSLKGKRYVP